MAQTVVSQGDALARKIFSVGLFSEAVRKASFTRNMIGPTPKQAQAGAKARKRSMQSSPAMPIVQITDLSSTAGDQVSVDMFGMMTGRVIMGDKKATGRGEPLKSSSQNIFINQHRKVADPGGRMTQKRTVHDLRMVSRDNLSEWFARYFDQQCLVHLAGGRGTENTIDWLIPLASDPEFIEQMVNPVTPPTRNRRFLVGDATGAHEIEVADVLKLVEIDKARAIIDEMPLPPSPIRMPKMMPNGGMGEPMDDQDPLFLLLLTSRQWHYLQIATGESTWRNYVAQATARYAINRHPLFLGQTAVWNNFLIKKVNRAVRWGPGHNVPAYNAAGAIVNETVSAGIHVDRALIVGGQALALAWGDSGMMYPSKWVEEESDGENALEIFGSMMFGKAKLQFNGTDNVDTDFGVITLDSYAPPVDSAAGATLRGVLQP